MKFYKNMGNKTETKTYKKKTMEKNREFLFTGERVPVDIRNQKITTYPSQKTWPLLIFERWLMKIDLIWLILYKTKINEK